jgi:hypothetical protein
MNDQEQIQITGHVTLKVYHRDGRLLESFEKKNLVVTTGRTAIARLLGGSVTGRSVSQIAFGEDGTAPTAGDTALTNSYAKSVDSVTYPESNSVLFTWSLGTGESNGKDIQELGLLCTNNDLFSRLTRATISKTSDLRLEGTWKIQF